MKAVTLISFFFAFQSVICVQPPNLKEQKRVAEAVNKLPPHVESTIRGLKAQGLPKEAINERVKNVAKNANISPEKLVNGVLEKDPKREAQQKIAEKKRKQQIANDIRKQEKAARKQKERRQRDL